MVDTNSYPHWRTAETAKRKPVLRRVYNECPVAFTIEPKWFERFVPDDEV